MKKKILMVGVLSILVVGPIGCERRSEPAPTITTNIASAMVPTNSMTTNNPADP